jgi:hypothetical protein
VVVIDCGGGGGVHEAVCEEEHQVPQQEHQNVGEFDGFIAGEAETAAVALVGVQTAQFSQHRIIITNLP